MVELSSQFGEPYFTKGGQGKLFPDPKPIDEHRYQRGYTPERMSQVRNANLEIVVGPARTQKTSDPQSLHHVHESIARSTIPVEDFPASPMTGNPLASVRMGAKSLRNAAGEWDAMKRRVSVRSQIRPIPTRELRRKSPGRQMTEQVLTHELGHAHSTLVARNEHAGPIFGSGEEPMTKMGKEEAYADIFEQQRWKPDPRDVRRGTNRDPSSSYESRRGWPSGRLGSIAHAAYLGGRKALGHPVKSRGPMQPKSKQDQLFNDRRD